MEPYLKRTIDLVSLALRDAKLNKTEIHELILVGGSSRIPKIHAMLFERFGAHAIINSDIDPD